MLIQFVQNSGVAAGLIAVILLLRRVRRLPSGCLDALWIAALVRLFIPFNLPSPFSIYRLLAHTPQPDTLSTSLTQSTVFAVNPLSPTSIFGVVWAIGAAFALTHLALSYLRLLHICRNAQPVCDPSILQAVQNAGLRRPVSVRTHPSITVPCTFGIMRPVILLPVDLEVKEDASMPYLLAHELTHIRRLDCLRKLLFQVVRCVHWFNPLVWLMCRAAGRDLERACDTAVLDTLSGDQRAAYAGALLNLAHAPRTAPLYSTFGTSDLEERIYSIMTFKKRSMISVLMTAAVVMTTTSAFATNVPEQNQAAVCQTATVVANNETSQNAGDDGITVTITSVDASTNPIDVENSLDVVSRETLPDGSIRLTLKDGSEVIAIKAVPSTEATAK
ncbi:MAG: M56 family metallopeptidase [Butyricicoccus pullicaecorum]